jgi:hypothetical protein
VKRWARIEHDPAAVRVPDVTTVNLEEQRRIYGLPLADVVFRITERLGITQVQLARTLDISPAMLSQLISGQRVRIGDPTALARLIVLDRASVDVCSCDKDAVRELLGRVATIHWQWPPTPRPRPHLAVVDAVQHH